MFSTFVNDRNGILCEPLEYEEVARVCSTLKLGVSGVEIDYEHIRYAGPSSWKLLFQLYQNYFDNFSVCDSLLTGVILPLFKCNGAKANNKDNYRGITLFPILCKIFEMVLLKRLEKFAEQMGLFSDMQFGFKEGVGCTEASFTILESINIARIALLSVNRSPLTRKALIWDEERWLLTSFQNSFSFDSCCMTEFPYSVSFGLVQKAAQFLPIFFPCGAIGFVNITFKWEIQLFP